MSRTEKANISLTHEHVGLTVFTSMRQVDPTSIWVRETLKENLVVARGGVVVMEATDKSTASHTAYRQVPTELKNFSLLRLVKFSA